MVSNEEPVQSLYRAIVDELRDVVFRTDAQGRLAVLNPAWSELTGYDVAASLGRTLPEFLHPEDRQRFGPLLAPEDGAAASAGMLEVRLRTAHGGFHWVAVNARPILDADGRPAGVSGLLSDITERKVLEEGLDRDRERAEAALRSLGEGVIVTETDGRIHLLNPEAERLLGWSSEDAVGRRLEEVFRIGEDAWQPAAEPEACLPRACPGQCAGLNAWVERADGTTLAVEWSAARALQPGAEGLGCVLVFRDVSTQRAMRQQMAYQATHDALTGLLNRGALQEALFHQVAGAARDGQPFSVVLMDLDRFKIANDNHGHTAGDQVLAALAERIGDHVRDADWFGRWGGEEFLWLLPATPADEAVRIAERIRRDIMDQPVLLEGASIPITASIGVASFPADGETGEELVRTADYRLYEAKRAGRNRVEAGLSGDGSSVLPMAGRIQRALDEERIVPAYEPIVELRSEEVVAEEALARMVDPATGELVPAAQFIEAASHLQLVHRIDEVLLTSTMERCSDMLLNGLRRTHFVNISTDLLRHRDQVDKILEKALRICERCGGRIGDEKPLIIEITEREFLEDTAEAHRILAPFLDYGFRIAVDDFGSGYSSFRYLADLPVSYLKIEGTLVRRATSEPRVQAILRGIRDIAGELELTTIAEMVEDQETADFLREIGIDLAQGFHFLAPEEAADAVG